MTILLRRLPILLIAGLTATMLMAAPAAADTVPSGAVTVQLGFSGGMGTQSTVWGNCGSAWADVIPLGNGSARIQWGAMALYSSMIYRNFTVTWSYTPQGPTGLPTRGTIYDISPMMPQVGYQGMRNLNLGPGGYAINMLGTATLITGQTCIVIPPGPVDFKTTT